jgi:hypothetical protein
MKRLIVLIFLFIPVFTFAQNSMPLEQAMDNCVSQFKNQLPRGARAAILKIEARSDGLSEYVTDNAFHGTIISTQNGKVSRIDVPFSGLKQPNWGRKAGFIKNNITGITIERQHDMGGNGASTIKIFGFEIY